MTVKTAGSAVVKNQAHYTTGSVISKDGTTIGYRQLGHGPGVVLLHGSMSSGYHHMQLAEALADAFTVYLPDRRGRGLSGAYPHNFRIQTEIDDLNAVLTETGARNIFAVSSGAIIALTAMLTSSAIHKAVIFEPPLSLTRTAAKAVLANFDAEINRGDIAGALITGMKGAQLGPPSMNKMPNWLLKLFVNMGMRSEDKKGTGEYVSMRALAPTLHYDFADVVEMSEQMERFRGIEAEVLLMGGGKSPAYLKTALDQLEKVLPHVQRIEFPDLDHAASWNADKGGYPEPIAQELCRFFADGN